MVSCQASLGCLIVGPLDTETEWGLLSTTDVELYALLAVTVPGAVPGAFAIGIDICHTLVIVTIP